MLTIINSPQNCFIINTFLLFCVCVSFFMPFSSSSSSLKLIAYLYESVTITTVAVVRCSWQNIRNTTWRNALIRFVHSIERERERKKKHSKNNEHASHVPHIEGVDLENWANNLCNYIIWPRIFNTLISLSKWLIGCFECLIKNFIKQIRNLTKKKNFDLIVYSVILIFQFNFFFIQYFEIFSIKHFDFFPIKYFDLLFIEFF